ncbi:hypothetical protein FHS32_001648 [Streptomyces albaduncus]|uniref:Uncharacterized protein n=1 Tax=Streptomyces griseoloalbus TaxID=67303 RepID=A0A7W8BM70_9ACTN|nr:hypothetical protein [Streptomyces albaduncus]
MRLGSVGEGDVAAVAGAYRDRALPRVRDQLEPGLELPDPSFAARRYSALMR